MQFSKLRCFLSYASFCYLFIYHHVFSLPVFIVIIKSCTKSCTSSFDTRFVSMIKQEEDCEDGKDKELN